MTKGKTVSARVSRDLGASPEQIFDAWLDPETVRMWMQVALGDLGLEPDVRRVEIDAREGGGFVFSDMREGEEAVHWGSYLEIDRPNRLRFSWFTSEEEEREDNSVVTLSVEPVDGRSRATIEHEMSAQWAEYVEQTKSGWDRMLLATEKVLSSH